MSGMTRDELLALPAVVDLTTAARALSIGRTRAFELVRLVTSRCRYCGWVSPTACRQHRCSSSSACGLALMIKALLSDRYNRPLPARAGAPFYCGAHV